MKRMMFIPLVIIIVIMFVATGCGGTTSPTTSSAPPVTATQQAATNQPASTTTPASAGTSAPPSTAPVPGKPIYGGILRVISPTFPTSLGYPPDFAPTDSIPMLPVLERLCQWDSGGSGKIVGVLAESWDVDTTALTLTWHLRKGIKFHDGTDFNADAVKWNYQLQLEARRIGDSDAIKSIDVLDPYTVRMNLSRFTSLMVYNFGGAYMISPTAFQKNGKDWARMNPVGTGPFMVKASDYIRDSSLKYTRNPNYWGKDAQGNQLPYLDGIELRCIPDTMTASATMEAKQADMWIDVSSPQNIANLKQKGLIDNVGPGFFWSLLPNSNNPNSPTSKKQVREAIEYAINRPQLADMIGSGQYEALTQLATKKSPGYMPNYNPRPFDPVKAKDLLAQAGYPSVKLTLETIGTMQDTAAAIKAYLAKVNIDVTVDVADMGRFATEVFGKGYTDDLVLAVSGINPDGTDLLFHFGSTPSTFRTGNIAKTQAYLDLCNKALATLDPGQQIPIMQQAIKQAGDDAMVIPIFRAVDDAILQPYVHSDYYLCHGTVWTAEDDWMDKH